ncbi:hydantoinase/oxoprolinase family protein [Pelagibius sp.]|uniref:hydantoinase/oxoprolinase family protein n=1 Tax=Pelagibius sp. TaxID=1931238 RepID=UPI003BAECE91
MRAGVEIGGTFTDIVLISDDDCLITHKVPSTPEDPSRAAVTGLVELVKKAGTGLDAITELFHGSTVATNTLIERNGAHCALVSTAGFEDVLLIGRQDKTRVYDMFYRKQRPLLGRERIFGLSERLSGQGEIVMPLSPQAIDKTIDEILDLGDVESVAVCLLHAYRNPVHEQAFRERWQMRSPGIPISLSCEVAPEFREYERASTTLIAAYVKKRVATYVERLERRLSEHGFVGRLLIMLSNGGVVPVEQVVANPAKTFLSGPAAGVTGAGHVAKLVDAPDLLTLDIGGTSCDACVIENGVPQNTQRGFAEYKIDGIPLSLMMLEIATLGAGGGSIAWVDGGGLLKVGPQSAGAVPGPACYGRGGEHFTVSDALLLLGMIDPDQFIGGQMHLDVTAAERAAVPLCEQLGIEPVLLAESVRRITVAGIATALRLVTVKRGFDPRDFSLLAYGGAGPVLAAAIAEEMGIGRVVVPVAPGLFSAFGLSVSDTKMDYVRSMPGTRAENGSAAAVADAFSSMRGQALEDFVRFNVQLESVQFTSSVDARYVGQGYELSVGYDPWAPEAEGLTPLVHGFHDAHAQRYGHGFPSQAVEIVGCRLVASSARTARALAKVPNEGSTPAKTAQMYIDGMSVEVQRLPREGLVVAEPLTGPAMVIETSSATIVPPGWTAEVLASGELLIRKKAGN